MRRRVGHTIAGRRQHPAHPASSCAPERLSIRHVSSPPKNQPGALAGSSGSCSRIIPGPTWRSSARILGVAGLELHAGPGRAERQRRSRRWWRRTTGRRHDLLG